MCASAQYAYGMLHATDPGSIDAPGASYLDPSVQAGGCGCDDRSCAPAAHACRTRTWRALAHESVRRCGCSPCPYARSGATGFVSACAPASSHAACMLCVCAHERMRRSTLRMHTLMQGSVPRRRRYVSRRCQLSCPATRHGLPIKAPSPALLVMSRALPMGRLARRLHRASRARQVGP